MSHNVPFENAILRSHSKPRLLEALETRTHQCKPINPLRPELQSQNVPWGIASIDRVRHRLEVPVAWLAADGPIVAEEIIHARQRHPIRCRRTPVERDDL